MNRTSFIKQMQSKKRKRTGATKLKIRWELLGLSAPQGTESSASIELIRQEVSSLASRGLGQGARSHKKDPVTEEAPQTGARGVRRRGATE